MSPWWQGDIGSEGVGCGRGGGVCPTVKHLSHRRLRCQRWGSDVISYSEITKKLKVKVDTNNCGEKYNRKNRGALKYERFFLSSSHPPIQNCLCKLGVQHDQFIGVAWPAFLINTAISQPPCPLFALPCPCNFPSLCPPCWTPLSSAARLSHTGRHLGKTVVDLNCETPESLLKAWPHNFWRLWNSLRGLHKPTELTTGCQHDAKGPANAFAFMYSTPWVQFVPQKTNFFLWLFWICDSIWASFNKTRH